ncbi:MAG: patatin protein [Adhaeribacter sp.]|nr:patatin protein [Adhaeribacter sp.]
MQKSTRLPASVKPALLYKALLFISGITVLTGLVQVVAAPLVLNFIGADTGKTSAHFFAIIGMFMALFGGLLWQSLRQSPVNPVPVWWCACQKIGAAAAVGLGVLTGIFSGLALGVALFDLLSGILIFIFWRKIQTE